jgi:hypothetical protein
VCVVFRTVYFSFIIKCTLVFFVKSGVCGADMNDTFFYYLHDFHFIEDFFLKLRRRRGSSLIKRIHKRGHFSKKTKKNWRFWNHPDLKAK